MGFNTAFVMLHPSVKYHTVSKTSTSHTSEKHTLWYPEQVISIGEVTRMEKLVSPRYNGERFASKQRAGICVTSWILGKLHLEINSIRKKGTLTRDDFAPSFILPFSDTYNEKRLIERHKEKGFHKGIQFMYGGIKELLNSCEVDEEVMGKHNLLLDQEPQILNDYIRKNGIVCDVPFLWESCETVACWLEEMELAESQEWQELEKDPQSLAYAKAWRAHITELQKTDVRIMFVFYPVLPSIGP